MREQKTARLTLRKFRTADWERVHIYGSDPDFSKYEMWGPNSVHDTHNFIVDMIKKSEASPIFEYHFAICLSEGDLLIGGCSLRRETEQSRVGALGWAINPEFQNQGYATEAAQALLRLAFDDLKLAVVYATCDTRNAASYRVMAKLGMQRVGFIKGTQEIKGHVPDRYRYEIVP
jgi:ribosomal-protein-alanine N-acetyltransferase